MDTTSFFLYLFNHLKNEYIYFFKLDIQENIRFYYKNKQIYFFFFAIHLSYTKHLFQLHHHTNRHKLLDHTFKNTQLDTYKLTYKITHTHTQIDTQKLGIHNLKHI
jgi:hypothetical protein